MPSPSTKSKIGQAARENGWSDTVPWPGERYYRRGAEQIQVSYDRALRVKAARRDAPDSQQILHDGHSDKAKTIIGWLAAPAAERSDA
ncbi:hypothetical protein E3_0140 [Rhodococcus phage E3]|uniref:hypothetical protein n=1 Tax=Rhodococcus phage E3 TaxID=1007869 RepID=UPI0002C696B0|nr:hypothetical protein M176_gp014 [Rhodococcus phage E3]AEQ20924.1 hypothetical protein E3_0140 [Rhodococcus phage E3]